MNINIRLANDNDIQSISTLYTEFFAYNAGQQPDYYIAASETGKYPSTVVNSDDGAIIIAEIDHMIVGFVHVQEEATPGYPSVLPHKFACIVDFIVNQQYRKNGIGHLLLAEVKSWAASRKLEYLELMVLENNDAGKNFYKREHFVTASRTLRLQI